MKITIDQISYKIVIITIFLLNIFIGSNIKSPIWIIQAIISTYATIYIFIKKVIYKEKNIFIKGKIDIAVLAFAISTTIPYIIKNYVSLSRNNKFHS